MHFQLTRFSLSFFFLAGFFTPGRLYRVPMFLSSSADWAMCQRTFCSRAQHQSGLPPVLFFIRINPEYKCVHVNFVKHTNCEGEGEFLFVPYSVFEVAGVEWRESPTWEFPHLIYVDAMSDNRNYPEDLPLAPWH